jgi:hypothetical protein
MAMPRGRRNRGGGESPPRLADGVEQQRNGREDKGDPGGDHADHAAG